jgi:hypothetical protein
VTPLTIPQLKVGHAYTIKLTLPGYQSIEKNVVIPAEATWNIQETLLPDLPALTVLSQPSGADVFLDDQSVGTTPYKNQSMSIGDVTLKVISNGIILGSQELHLKHGDDIVVQY